MVLNIMANNKKRGKLATIFSQEPKKWDEKMFAQENLKLKHLMVKHLI